MKKVGEITLPKTTTENPLSIVRPGGDHRGGPLARRQQGRRCAPTPTHSSTTSPATTSSAALTTGKPRVTPLADPFGEAIAYTPDGKTFVTVSDGGQLAEDEPIDILSYTPSTSVAATGGRGRRRASRRPTESWYDGLTLDEITYLVGAVGVLGLLLVGAGIVGILRARRRPPAAGRPVDGSGPRCRSRTTERGARQGRRRRAGGRTADPARRRLRRRGPAGRRRSTAAAPAGAVPRRAGRCRLRRRCTPTGWSSGGGHGADRPGGRGGAAPAGGGASRRRQRPAGAGAGERRRRSGGRRRSSRRRACYGGGGQPGGGRAEPPAARAGRSRTTAGQRPAAGGRRDDDAPGRPPRRGHRRSARRRGRRRPRRGVGRLPSGPDAAATATERLPGG